MKNLDSQFIDAFTRRSGRYLKAVRNVLLLETCLHSDLPAPDEINLAKTPYGLEVVWNVQWANKVQPLRDQLDARLNMGGKWHIDTEDGKKSLTKRGRLYPPIGKDSLPVIIRIKIVEPGDD